MQKDEFLVGNILRERGAKKRERERGERKWKVTKKHMNKLKRININQIEQLTLQ